MPDDIRTQDAEDLLLFSVDDHVLEPPRLWEERLPRKYVEVGPRIVTREGPIVGLPDSKKGFVNTETDGPVEYWAWEDQLMPTTGLNVAASMDSKADYTSNPVTYAQMRPGCYDPVARLADMDEDGVSASVCFPSMAGFAGNTFVRFNDKHLALLCVQAYNDWMIDEWCGTAPNRLVPMCLLPLWDPALAVKEVERVAAKGARAIGFNENPSRIGLPSIHHPDRPWDPVFSAASEANLPLCMHIGSSSEVIVTAPDAPASIFTALVPLNAQITTMDWLLSGLLLRHPDLRIVLSEGGIGWIPYLLDRADYAWQQQGAWTNSPLAELPSVYFREHFFGCFIDDPHGIECIDKIGADLVMIETDFPHSDSTFPNSRDNFRKHIGHLDEATIHKIVSGNAERVFGFTPGKLGER